MGMPHYDVIIITPGYSMLSAYVKSLTATIAELQRLNISWTWLSEYSSLVHNAREIAVGGDTRLDPDDHGPLHGQCTYGKMVWIDSDISWTVEAFMRLVNADLQIVTGAYLLANGVTSVISTDIYPEGIPKSVILNMRNVIQARSMGFGFVAIKSGVFETMERPWFGMLTQTIQDSNGKQLLISLSEDISWCIRAKSAGFTIYFDPMVLVGHHKTVEVGWK